MVLKIPSGLFGQEDVRETPSATATASSTIIAPIGSLLPWLKSYTNTPQALPTGWVEADGATVSDADSVYDGQVLPDLNGGEFLRGFTTSGGTGGAATHALIIAELAAHSHTVSGAQGVSAGSARLETTNTSQQTTPSTSTTGSGTAHENLPPYYNVVWIIRIK